VDELVCRPRHREIACEELGKAMYTLTGAVRGEFDP